MKKEKSKKYPTIVARDREGLLEAIDQYAEAEGLRIQAQAVRAILREGLKTLGYWPPNDKQKK